METIAMAIWDEIGQSDQAEERKRLYGAYVGVVSDIVDPDNQGRIKVKVPWSPDDEGGTYAVWARLATMFAGNARGSWFIADPGDEVLIMFEGGDPRRPIVVGGLWNGKDAPPETMDGAGNNYKKSIVSRRNIRITLDDTDGQETLTLKTPAGQSIVINDGGPSIVVTDANGNTVTLDTSGVSIQSPGTVSVECETLDATAAQVNVNTPMAIFSGVVQCETLLATLVSGTTYTPGVGNLL
jgi:uncharacterized protein involved in type VI secretion and phage assembly